MQTVWDTGARNDLLTRFARLAPDQKPRWGKMNAAQMVAHCMDPMRAAMGEITVSAIRTPLRIPLLRYLVIYKLPWPKGAPTAREFIHEGAENLETNRTQLTQVLQRFAAHQGKPFHDHPAFGPLTEQDWGRLTWRHLHHHLNQFGV